MHKLTIPSETSYQAHLLHRSQNFTKAFNPEFKALNALSHKAFT